MLYCYDIDAAAVNGLVKLKRPCGCRAYSELGHLDAVEVPLTDFDRRCVGSVFPDSFLAASERASQRWRQDIIRTHLERDIPMLGPRIAAETLRRF